MRALDTGPVLLAIRMFLAFPTGTALSSKGDPFLGILLVPLGAVALLAGLLLAALAECSETA